MSALTTFTSVPLQHSHKQASGTEPPSSSWRLLLQPHGTLSWSKHGDSSGAPAGQAVSQNEMAPRMRAQEHAAARDAWASEREALAGEAAAAAAAAAGRQAQLEQALIDARGAAAEERTVLQGEAAAAVAAAAASAQAALGELQKRHAREQARRPTCGCRPWRRGEVQGRGAVLAGRCMASG